MKNSFNYTKEAKVLFNNKENNRHIGLISGNRILPRIYWWIFIINLFITKVHPIYVQRRVSKYKKRIWSY